MKLQLIDYNTDPPFLEIKSSLVNALKDLCCVYIFPNQNLNYCNVGLNLYSIVMKACLIQNI